MRRILTFLLIICCLNTLGQSLMQQPVERESVTKIMKTDKSIMLFGTDDGLIAYDGTLTMRFTTNDCMRPFTFVNDIAQLSNGMVLVGMRNGLYEANMESKTCRRVYDDLTEVTCILQYGKDSLFIGCKGGLAVVPTDMSGKARIVPIDKSNVTSANNNVLCATVDEHHNLWMASGNNRIVSYSTKTHKIKEHHLNEAMLSSGITCMVAMNHCIYIATLNNGLLRFNENSNKLETIHGVWPSVKEIRRHGNALYICTDGDGAFVLQENRLRQLTTIYNSVYSCFHDAALNKDWFGYYQNGVSNTCINGSPFKTYKHSSFDSKDVMVRSFCKHGSQLLIGTLDGLYYMDEKSDAVTHFSRQDIGCAIITDIKYFADLFVVTTYEHGVFIFNPRTLAMRQLTLGTGFDNTSCSKLIVAPDSTLYVGSSAGLFRLNRKLEVTHHYDSQHSDILGNFIFDMALDNSGKLWVSTAKGMRILNTKTKRFQNSGYPNGFWNDAPNLSFGFTQGGDILAASETSLLFSKADLSDFRKYDIMQKLGIGQIAFIMPMDGRYVTGTDKGLFVFDKTFESVHQYSEADGLPSSRFSRFACFCDNEGNIWMANKKGLVSIKKKDLLNMEKKRNAKVYVSRFAIEHNGRATEIDYVKDGSIKAWWNFGTDKMVITPTMLDYNAFQSRRYYIWSIDDKPRSVAFNMHDIELANLSLGLHTLCIQQAGHPETMTTITIEVLPSASFYIEMLIISLLIVIGILFVRQEKRKHEHYRLMRQKHRIELKLASVNAVNQHKQEEKDRQAQAALIKQKEKEATLMNRADDYKLMAEKIEAYMQSEKPFLRNNLRLSELATKAGTNATTLSQMFNDYLHTSYFDYVNHYRVEEFKRRATAKEYSNLTLLAISEQCGFKRSSFFNVFKKHEGCTPSEWVKKATGQEP